MRALLQRVKQASVTVEEEVKSSIGKGLLIFIGIENEDGQEDIEWLTRKILNMRIFDDENGDMNKSVMDVDGEMLVISQFTLHARVKKGNRPSYIDAAKPDVSVPLYEQFVNQLEKESGKKIGIGEFGAMMDVGLINDGPVTIWMDSKRKE
ncbi:MAG: D-tyrosyl-tRNA(Tyr) deacylase [Bacteroidetes bacterium SW_11_45_7]|nr:MAG: D-tyrosyl-tRNA(Tyr) deacylase [Bacteroidetes bacterium SW_11_45_7]